MILDHEKFVLVVSGWRGDKEAAYSLTTLQRHEVYDRIKPLLSASRVPFLFHGGATGVDEYVDHIAGVFGDSTSIQRYPANWTKYGNSAGPRRNKRMLYAARDRAKCEDLPWVLFGFPLPNVSRGTPDCIATAIDYGFEIHSYPLPLPTGWNQSS
jgi:hypothetical protein